jgi:hypothetical protein
MPLSFAWNSKISDNLLQSYSLQFSSSLNEFCQLAAVGMIAAASGMIPKTLAISVKKPIVKLFFWFFDPARWN